MKRHIILFGLAFMAFAACKSDDDVDPEFENWFETCLVYVDGEFLDIPLDMEPVYIHGGQDSMSVHLLREIRYPVEARENSIHGFTLTSYEISETGAIENILDAGSEHEILAEATIQAISMFLGQAVFKPAELDGEPVRVQKTIRVTYKLE